MAAVSSLSEVNAKLEVQRSFVIDKALELHNLVKQLQTNGTNTFGRCTRIHAFDSFEGK